MEFRFLAPVIISAALGYVVGCLVGFADSTRSQVVFTGMAIVLGYVLPATFMRFRS